MATISPSVEFIANCIQCKCSFSVKTKDLKYKFTTNFVRDARNAGWAVSYLRGGHWTFHCPNCRNYSYVRNKETFDGLFDT